MTLKKLSLALLACLTLTACGGVDPNSPLGKRQAIFKQMLKTSEDFGGMLRGRIPFDGARFTAGAIKLDSLSQQPWQHFPQVKETDKTSAKPEVWESQARFQELARQLEGATAALVVATTQQPLDPVKLGPPVQAVEDACETCHKAFRTH
ncbi:cytochrome c [Pseudomonas cavernicola]|uniref:Cytochrome c n=1 Tax=Pseudomonas cavernicola TaxID=2320866 RepID=A0A418XJ06_9PSED|nr:cytochrome c [Pseudomonas cavernicola]RJG12444.1 cytochrome c [Pseudomonas cavernicola]